MRTRRVRNIRDGVVARGVNERKRKKNKEREREKGKDEVEECSTKACLKWSKDTMGTRVNVFVAQTEKAARVNKAHPKQRQQRRAPRRRRTNRDLIAKSKHSCTIFLAPSLVFKRFTPSLDGSLWTKFFDGSRLLWSRLGNIFRIFFYTVFVEKITKFWGNLISDLKI